MGAEARVSVLDHVALSQDLPVNAIRSELLQALARGPVVLSSPTGSGKSMRER
jgi:HrpA-like RNA helicase